MGDLLGCKCSCGYAWNEMTIGSGMSFPETRACYLPAFWEKRRKILLVNLSNYFPDKQPDKAGYIFYNDPRLMVDPNAPDRVTELYMGNDFPEAHLRLTEGEFILPDTLYLCPACREKRMRFFDMGCWD